MDGFDDEMQSSSPMNAAISHGFSEGVRLLLENGHPVTADALLFAVNFLDYSVYKQ